MSTAQQAARKQANAAGVVHVCGYKSSGGLQVREQGRALADALKIVDAQRNSSFAGESEQVQDRVRGTTSCRHAGDSVLEGFARQDSAWAQIVMQELHHHLARVE